jgi:hypothetical protein
MRIEFSHALDRVSRPCGQEGLGSFSRLRQVFHTDILDLGDHMGNMHDCDGFIPALDHHPFLPFLLLHAFH